MIPGWEDVVDDGHDPHEIWFDVEGEGWIPADEFVECGGEVLAVRYSQRILDELRQLGESRTAGMTSNALTQRERDALALITQGSTNRQIDRQLYISEKTVSVHVSNLLRKTGTSSRVEVAAYARRHGVDAAD